MGMGYPTTVQLIQRRRSQQWYVNFPAAVANAVAHATGIRIRDLPITRDRLIAAMEIVS